MSRFRAFATALLLAAPLSAQSPTFVDSAGVLRWTATRTEVARFGVTYAVSGEDDDRAIGRLAIDHKAAIDADVAHLARLGVDAVRVPVGDRALHDSLGALLVNAYLDRLDYLLWSLEQRGISVVLTPIATRERAAVASDALAPQPAMPREPRALATRARYLQQVMAHVNPYTRTAYGRDPTIIAVELSADALPDGLSAAAITDAINTLVAAARRGGAVQPIVADITARYTPEVAGAICAANVQGVSGQWYPTGLGRGTGLLPNLLPTVDRYVVPFAGEPACAGKARLLAEFDAADVMRPVMYPAMARSLRTAGFQWATQFAYDPMALAASNAEFPAHYLNLAYTPAKAISLLIAGEVFRHLPRDVATGAYPTSAAFGWPGAQVRLDASGAGRSELVTDTLLAHTGPTTTVVRTPGTLRHVAAVGSSPLVQYAGSGAYFLDRLAPGVWRLEVMPDAEPVADPFTPGTAARAVTRLVHRAQAMQLRLPELAGGVRVRPLNAGNRWQPAGMATAFTVKPGVYLLTTATAKPATYAPGRAGRRRTLGEYSAPPPTADSLVLTARRAARRLTQDDSAREAWAGRVPASARALFDAGRDFARVITPGVMDGVHYRSELVPAYNTVPAAWRLAIDDFGRVAWHVAFRSVVPEGLRPQGDTLLITGRTATPGPVEIALIMRDGSAWGTRVTFTPKLSTIPVALADLARVPLVLLPRPSPAYQPYDLLSDASGPLDLAQLDGVQVGVARGEGRRVVEITRVGIR